MKLTTSLLFLLALSACQSPCVDSDADGAVAGAGCTEDLPLDCDDHDAAVHPGADEICDTVDNDCDGEVDEVGATDGDTWYADADADGFGSPEETVIACSLPDGYVQDATDCDDALASVNPSAIERCTGVDDDCDGLVDIDDPDVVGTQLAYPDTDGDGFGDTEADGYEVCELGEGESPYPEDCDDSDAGVSPEAQEVCDEDQTDEDCDGYSDDEDTSVDPATQTAWYPDVDQDGYGDADLPPTIACHAPAGMVADSSDCDDADDQIPGVVSCRTGTYSLDPATLNMKMGSSSYSCTGAVLVTVDNDGGILGEDMSCEFSGLSGGLDFDITGSITTDPSVEGEVDFAASGGPLYDFTGDFTDWTTLHLDVDQTADGVTTTLSWDLAME